MVPDVMCDRGAEAYPREAPESPSAANDQQQRRLVNLKLARALNP